MKRRYVLVAAAGLVFLSGAGLAAGAGQCGRASWYAIRNTTASGEMMNPDAMTAAHPSLPFGTRIRVTNQGNGRQAEVRINDRGPFVKGRILDLSRAAAATLGFKNSGIAEICFARV